MSDAFSKVGCFDGVSSSVKKGAARTKAKYSSKLGSKKRKEGEAEDEHDHFDIIRNLFVSIGILMGATVVIMKCLKRKENEDSDDDN